MAKTDVATRKSGTGLANWQDRLAGMAKQAVEQEASVATGQFIGTKAGQLTWNGNPVQGNKLEVVVVDSILENAYYVGKFDSDNPQPPVCFSFGRNEKEMKPHPDSVEPQHETCAGCPMNEFKSADTGKGKACKNIRRLGLIAAKPLTPEALEKGEVAFLKTPVTSVKAWASYVRGLEALSHLPPLAVVTEIGAIPDAKTQFKLTFNAGTTIPDKLMPIVMDRYDEISKSIDFPYAPPSAEPEQLARGAKSAGRNNKTGRSKY